jgi:hypothetical protein
VYGFVLVILVYCGSTVCSLIVVNVLLCVSNVVFLVQRLD